MAAWRCAHVADKILNHQTGTISWRRRGLPAHEFLAERRAALDLWGVHVAALIDEMVHRMDLKEPSHDLPL